MVAPLANAVAAVVMIKVESMSNYEDRKRRLCEEIKAGAGAGVGLYKGQSNLFRDRKGTPGHRLNVADFNHVLKVDPVQGWVEVEGMTPYAALVDATLPYGVMPAVVPELKSITIGGAVAGVGIESSSFRYGLAHETVLEMDVLLAGGEVLRCAPDNEQRDLFFGFPNSYGALGYALKLKARTIPIKPYVALRHIRYAAADACFQGVADWCGRADVDFVDGVAFGPDELYLTIGTFTENAPYASDYTYEHIYYRSIRERETDYLSTLDYIWRWDTDWFWCSKNLYAQQPWLRRLVGRKRLNSITYTRIMRWNSRWGLTKRLNRLLGWHTESVIQDVDIPLARAAEFLAFFQREIGIAPVWLCPVRAYDPAVRFDLFPLRPDTLYVNFGFWDVVKTREPHPPGYFNRKIERRVAELGGLKSLYSEAFYPPDEFWRQYDQAAYARLKGKYDPGGALKDLYQKAVMRE